MRITARTMKAMYKCMAAVALLTFAACSNEDVDDLLVGDHVAAQVTASISNVQTLTRVSTSETGASFTTGDVIHVVADGSATYDYTLQSDGTWSAGSYPYYYFQDLNDVSFQGWYADPTLTVTDNSISIHTTKQTISNGCNQWDILVAPQVSASASSPTIDFTGDNAFSHIMSQMTLTFKAGDGISDLSALTGYALKSLTTDATFNTQSCELTTGSSTGDITQTITGSSVEEITSASLILVPQTVTDGKIALEVTYNSQTYTTSLTLPSNATALAAGTHYIFSVTISNTGLTVSSAEIAAWTAAKTQSSSATIEEKVVDNTYIDENGTRSYTVYNEADLMAWSEYTRSGYWDTNCTLATDITLTSTWTAVGDSSNPYTGTFDGNGKTITGLTISASSDYQGLIGYLGRGGLVKSLTMADVSVSNAGDSYTGAVVGYNNLGTVTDCSASGTVSGNYYTGGVVGLSWAYVTACYFTGTVSGEKYTGGVVGDNAGGFVTACYSTGSVSSTGDYTGGVVGYKNTGSVIVCYWTNSSTDEGAATYGIGEPASNEFAVKVEGSVTWATAASTMNTELTNWDCQWQYEVNTSSGAPLLLEYTTE